MKIDNRDDEKEQDEDRVYGSVTWRTYWKFLRAGTSTVGLVLAMLLCLVSQVMTLQLKKYCFDRISRFTSEDLMNQLCSNCNTTRVLLHT